MNSKNIFIVALGALCGLAIAPAMAQAKEAKLSGRLATAAVEPGIVGVTPLTNDVISQGKGTFGQFTSRAYSEFSDPVAPSENCEGFDYEFSYESSSFVNTYNDLSQFYGVLDAGYVCQSLDGSTKFVVEYAIVGGSGRFEGATGTVTVQGAGVSFSEKMGAYTSTFTGTLSLDD